jgi:uncharacterized protein with HEPN domain
MKIIKKQLKDMIHIIGTIELYSNSNYETFLEDGKTQDAILYNLVILGEITNAISQDFKDAHPEIAWSQLVDTRNIIIPGKEKSNPTIVWNILHQDLWNLKKSLSNLMKHTN